MQPIDKVSVMNRTVDSICQLISSSEYSIGDKLPSENDFCQRLNVGRSTIREALHVIQAKGMIEIVHGKGAFIRKKFPPDSNDAVKWFSANKVQLEDLMNVRLAIEQMAVKLASQRINERELEELRQIYAGFEQATAAGDVTGMVLFDEQFHEKIASASGNALLDSICKQISAPMRDYRVNSFTTDIGKEHALFLHKAILDGLMAHSKEESLKAITEHIKYSLFDAQRVIAMQVLED